jgi:heterodisulfide reductase subunit A
VRVLFQGQVTFHEPGLSTSVLCLVEKLWNQFAATLPGVAVSRDYLYMCSDPGQALIRQDIEEQGLNGVVVASCSPRMHEPTFRGAAQQAGLNPYLVEMANIREQCSWVHTNREGATEKAKLLVASAVAKAALLAPLEEREVEVTPGAVVIGGGIAGMAAALDVATITWAGAWRTSIMSSRLWSPCRNC